MSLLRLKLSTSRSGSYTCMCGVVAPPSTSYKTQRQTFRKWSMPGKVLTYPTNCETSYKDKSTSRATNSACWPRSPSSHQASCKQQTCRLASTKAFPQWSHYPNASRITTWPKIPKRDSSPTSTQFFVRFTYRRRRRR